MPDIKSSPDVINQHMGWASPVPVQVSPEQARRVLQAVLNDVNPAVMGSAAYPVFLNSVRYVGAQFGVDL